MINYLTQKQINETINIYKLKDELRRWDLNDEMVALSKEANEFYMAYDFLSRLEAFLNFLYVATGTKTKFYARKITVNHFPIVEVENEQLLGYIDDVAEYLYEGLKCEYGEFEGVGWTVDYVLKDCYNSLLKYKDTDKVSMREMMSVYFDQLGVECE